MDKRSNLTVPQRQEVVLILLRQEEPAGKLARRYHMWGRVNYRNLYFRVQLWQAYYN